MRNYFVYILAGRKNGTLYTGVTNNIEHRTYEHKNKIIKGFTEKYDVNKLVYYEEYKYIIDAINREKQLKNWHREWKINLIKSVNPDWRDLSEDWQLKLNSNNLIN